MTASKLSPAQVTALKEVCDNTLYTCVDRYAPAKKLVELGLATSEERSYRTLKLTPTQAGRDLRAKL